MNQFEAMNQDFAKQLDLFYEDLKKKQAEKIAKTQPIQQPKVEIKLNFNDSAEIIDVKDKE